MTTIPKRLGLTEAVLMVLSDGQLRTPEEIARLADRNLSSVSSQLSVLSRAGVLERQPVAYRRART